MRGWMLAATFSVVLAATWGCSGGKDPLLAKVGQKEVHASDLIDQYRAISAEYRPHLSSPDSTMRFLNTIVQKDVLVAEARARHLQSEPETARRIADDRKQILLPELLNGFLEKMPAPPPDELAALGQALSQRYHLHVLMSTNKDYMQEVHRRLQTGTPWRAIEASWDKDPVGMTSGDKGFLTLDGFPEDLRREIVRLSPGSYSQPIEYGGVQNLVYLEAREKDANAEPAAAESRARTVWERDWRERTVKAHLDDEKGQRNFKINDTLLLVLTGYFVAAESTRVAWPQLTDEQRKADLVTWDGGHMTVGDFLSRFEAVPLYARPRLSDFARTRVILDQIAGEEVLMNEVEASGLPTRVDMAKKLERSEERLLLDRVRDDIVKDARPTAEEKKLFYDENPDLMKIPAEQHVIAVVRPDSAAAWASYLAIRNGTDPREEARLHSIHESKASGGDIGWVSPTHLPELVPHLVTIRVNRSASPFQAPSLGGWAVLRVIEARGERVGTVEDMDIILTDQTMKVAQDRVLAEWLAGKQKEVKLYPKRVAKLVIPADLLPSHGTVNDSTRTSGAAGMGMTTPQAGATTEPAAKGAAGSH